MPKLSRFTRLWLADLLADASELLAFCGFVSLTLGVLWVIARVIVPLVSGGA